MRIFKNEKPMVELGGVSLPLNKAMILSAGPSPASNYDTFKYQGDPYLVPAGKSLIIVAQRIQNTAATSVWAKFGHADASVDNSSTAPTNYEVIDIGNLIAATEATAGKTMSCPCEIVIPEGKYPTAQSGGGGAYVQILAYLKDA